MKKHFLRDWVLGIAIGLLILTAITVTVFLFSDHKILFAIFMPIVLVLSGAVCVTSFMFITNWHRTLVKLDSRINFMQRESLYGLPVASVVVDDNREILWHNDKCRDDLLSGTEMYGKSLDMITKIPLDKLCENFVDLICGDKYLTAYAYREENEPQPLTMIYFMDKTDYRALEKEHQLSHPTVMILNVDNYEELFAETKESEKAYITGQLENLLEDFIAQTNGILRKLSSRSFLAVVEERHLIEILEGKFKLLNDARKIKLENGTCATLSIGVGRGAKTLSESEAFANQALDMALGRGGDQAAVKTENGFDFYGGVSKGVEKRTRVKTRVVANAVLELMDEAERVIVMGHKLADFDAFGSSVALARVAKNMGKEVFVAIDKQRNLAKALIDHIVDKNMLDALISPTDAVELVNDKTLLFIVDTHNPDFIESKKLYNECKKVVVIDHHRKMVSHIDKAVIFYHEPYASSVSEMVAELIQYLGVGGKITKTEAELLLAGIMLDTKNFIINSGSRTFEAAAYLRKLGAETATVRGFFANSIDDYRLRSKIVAEAEIYKDCAISRSQIKGANIQAVSAQAADEMLGISGVDASFVIYSLEKETAISARSFGAVNVQIIMEMLGGGGHLTMAAAQLKGVTSDEAELQLKAAIDKYYEDKDEEE